MTVLGAPAKKHKTVDEKIDDASITAGPTPTLTGRSTRWSGGSTVYSATVFRNRSGFLWGSEVSLSRILSSVTAIAVAVGANGTTRPSLVADRFNLAVNNYKITGKYRRNIFRPWLFLELVPETNWRRVEAGNREFIPAFTVRLEINSEGPRALLPVPLIVNEPLPIPGYDPNPVFR